MKAKIFDCYFDDKFFDAADRLVEKFGARGELGFAALRKWEKTREYARARALFASSQHARESEQKFYQLLGYEAGKLWKSTSDFDDKFHQMMRGAKVNKQYEDDLALLHSYGVPLIELVNRVSVDGLFKAPKPKGPRGPCRTGYNHADRLMQAKRVIRIMIRRRFSREVAVRALCRHAYPEGVRRFDIPGPGTPEAFRKGLYPVVDRMLWRLEGRRYGRGEKRRGTSSPSTQRRSAA